MNNISTEQCLSQGNKCQFLSQHHELTSIIASKMVNFAQRLVFLSCLYPQCIIVKNKDLSSFHVCILSVSSQCLVYSYSVNICQMNEWMEEWMNEQMEVWIHSIGVVPNNHFKIIKVSLVISFFYHFFQLFRLHCFPRLGHAPSLVFPTLSYHNFPSK